MVITSKSVSWLLLVGRILISLIFLMAGLNKFMNYDATAQMISSKGIEPNALLVYGAGLIEVIGALSLIFGFKTRWGALLLFLFLIPSTFIMHDFWNFSGMEMQNQMIHFLSNLAILGGLLHVIATGPGCCSCDLRHTCDVHDLHDKNQV
ncbi:MAG: DoxX family protein [Waddliaceae bacterium]